MKEADGWVMRRLFFLFAFSVSLCGHALAESPDETEAATRRGLERVKQAASDWQTHKTCFSCHHQTLPMLAVTEAARVGFPMDETWLASQAKTTHDYFSERIEDMNNGDHVPGGSTTVGYGF